MHVMSGARTDLVNAVQRIGTREGLTFGVPLTKPLSVADLTVIGNSLLDPGSGARGWSDAAHCKPETAGRRDQTRVAAIIAPACGTLSSAHNCRSRSSVCAGRSCFFASERNFSSTSASVIGFFQWPRWYSTRTFLR